MELQILLRKLKENNIDYCQPLIFNSKLSDIKITGGALNSKYIERDWAFFALKGQKNDGNLYINEAVQNGASVIFTDTPYLSNDLNISAPVICVKNLKQYLNTIAQLIYGVNEKDFFFIGVTGTNGKTTTTYLIEHILNSCGKKCAKLGTVEYSVLDYKEKSVLTTPDIFTIYRVLREAKKRKAKFVVMEMSSHSLIQERIDITNFKHSIFTNIGHDHLDYHKNFEEYIRAKLKLFKFMNEHGIAIINKDDENSRRFICESNADVVTYGMNQDADARIYNEKLSHSGSEFYLKFNNKEYHMNTKLIGLYNIYNIAAAFVSCTNLVEFTDKVIEAIAEFKNPPGRLEKVENREFHIYIDYAHTPQALQNVLNTLRNLKDKNSKLICVFGCGGDRDKEKRPLMGKIASELADVVILTSDNPRSEDPYDILRDIKKGIIPDCHSFERGNLNINSEQSRESHNINYQYNTCKVYEEIDRKKAIKMAIDVAKKGDVIIVSGKGHEDYQIFKDRTIRFSDKEVILECLG